MCTQDKAHCVNMAIYCTLIEIALKVSQSILRCGDGLIRGRVNMIRVLVCLMGMFSTIYNKIQIWYFSYGHHFDKYNDSKQTA